MSGKEENWQSVCDVTELEPNIGVRALLERRQVAIFRIEHEDAIYAIDAVDPFTDVAVLFRGIIGDIKGELVVASPIYKQHFSLKTGRCLEDESVNVATFPTRIVDGVVQISLV